MGKNKKNKKSQQPQQQQLQQQESQAERTRREQRQAQQDAADHAFLDEQIATHSNKKDETEAVLQKIKEDELPLIQSMPKIELHAHLSGSLSTETIMRIVESDKKKHSQVISKYLLDKPGAMKTAFQSFAVIEKLLDSPASLKIAVFHTIREFFEDGCIYLELRTTPKENRFMSREVYLRTVITSIQEARVAFPKIKVFLIVSINRNMTYDVAQKVLEITGHLQLESNVIIGLELSGDPSVNAAHLIQIFYVARRFHGLGVTVHMAEMKEHLEDALDYMMLLPDRIGHGTFLRSHTKLHELQSHYRLPLEICLSSNVFTKTVPNAADSHFNYWRHKGVPVSINTDDKGIIPGATLSEEYFKASIAFDLSVDDLIGINRQALKASFANKYSATDLRDLWRRIEENTLE